MYNNNFTFDKNHLLQTNVTATGAPNSCSYPDIAINRLDRLIEQEQANNFTELFFFGRYKNDCFVLWNGSKDRLDECFSFLNVLDCDLKLTMEIGKDHLCFLDLKTSAWSKKLMTTVCSKTTDSHLYLQSTLCHKSSSINGTPKGVALRLRRICSTTQELQSKAKEYSASLVARGHNLKTVKSKKWESVTFCCEKEKESLHHKFLCNIFDRIQSSGPKVSKIYNKHRHLLESDDTLKQLFPKNYIIVANKRGRNLQELLTRADPYNIKSDLLGRNFHGYKKCGKN